MAIELDKKEAEELLTTAHRVRRYLLIEMYDKPRPSSRSRGIFRAFSDDEQQKLEAHIRSAHLGIFKTQSPDVPANKNTIDINELVDQFNQERVELINYSKKWKQPWKRARWTDTLDDIDKTFQKAMSATKPRRQIHGNHSLNATTWLLAHFLFWDLLPSHKDILALAKYNKEIRKHNPLISAATVSRMVEEFNKIAEEQLKTEVRLELAQAPRGKKSSNTAKKSKLIDEYGFPPEIEVYKL